MPKKVSSVCKQNFSKTSYAHIESSIHNPAKKIRRNFETSLLIFEKDKNTYIFFEKSNFLPVFPVVT